MAQIRNSVTINVSSNNTYDDSSPKWQKLFTSAKVSFGGTDKLSSITVSGIPAGAQVALTANGADSVIINNVKYTVTLGNGTAYITSHAGITASSGWASALKDLRIDATSASSIANAQYNLTVSGTDTAQNLTGSAETLTVTCFYPGTLIRTPSGEVAVETLKHGDLVLTHDGRQVPVAWLGRQTISTVFADQLRALPIRIKAGALGENVPQRDLLVSPDHAMFIDGVLIHAGALVNGASIVRETNVPEVFTYYHVEVEDHSLIFAEGAPAETFVDNVDRLGFDNWDEYEALYPEGKTVAELPYPRAKARRQVPVAIRVALAARAGVIGEVAEVGAVA